MAGTVEKKAVPLRQGLFKLADAAGKNVDLIGSKCKKCSKYSHPRRYVCLNCGSQDMTEVLLSRKGKIRTYTIVTTSLPTFLVTAPYVIAAVDLPEGVGVQTILSDCEPERVRIGMDVEIAPKKVGKDAEGNDQIAFVFKPVG